MLHYVNRCHAEGKRIIVVNLYEGSYESTKLRLKNISFVPLTKDIYIDKPLSSEDVKEVNINRKI